jgi:hypothetical protein
MSAPGPWVGTGIRTGVGLGVPLMGLLLIAELPLAEVLLVAPSGGPLDDPAGSGP